MKTYLKPLLFVLIGAVLAATVTYTTIYASYRDAHPQVHFHANFAMYLNGTKVDFSNTRYMEDIASCQVSGALTPRERVHLHNGVGDLAHVHDTNVTWGNFFTNLGYMIDDTHIITDSGTVYTAGDTSKIRFILNGKAINSPFNTYIHSEDRLLISFGDQLSQDTAMQQYLSVSSTAKEFNTKLDPASCSGSQKKPFMFMFWK